MYRTSAKACLAYLSVCSRLARYAKQLFEYSYAMSHVALNIVAEFKAKQGMQDRVRQALERMIEPTQNEPDFRQAKHQGPQH